MFDYYELLKKVLSYETDLDYLIYQEDFNEHERVELMRIYEEASFGV